jgi:hypothetical protein
LNAGLAGILNGSTFSGQHLVECARARSRLPRFEHGIHVLLEALNRVYFDVIGAERVDYVVVLAGIACPSVSPKQFTPLKLRKWAVKSNKEHVERLKELHEARHPSPGLDDVFDDEVIAGFRECRQATVEPFEKRSSYVRPRKVPIFDALHGQDAGIAEVIY